MQHTNPPRVWHAFVVPAALGVFYCVMLCLSYPHMASAFPTHFNASGKPDNWSATGPILLASLVVIGIIFLVLGISTIRSATTGLGWWIVGIVFAAFVGASVGASVEFIDAVRAFRMFHAYTWILWAVAAALAEALFLLIPRWPARRDAGASQS